MVNKNPAGYKTSADKKTKKYLNRVQGDDFLAEAIIIGKKPVYAVVKGNEAKLQNNVDEYWPPASSLSEPYRFKSEQDFNEILERAKHESLDTLYQKVRKMWNKYSKSETYENELCAADTIFTYYQMRFGMTHYLFFVGSPDSGKSNKLLLFKVLGYRNFTTLDMSASNIYRHLGCVQEGQGTLCEDEAEDLDEDLEKLRIYKNGYTSGYRVPRSDKDDNNIIGGYYTFCFKAFSAEKLPDSVKARGLKTRIIEIPCIADVPDLDITEVLSPGDDDELVLQRNRLFELRNLLFCYMLLHCHDKIKDLKLNITNREKQLFKPIIRLFQDSKCYDSIIDVISHFVSERREINTDSLLSFLFRIIYDLVKEKGSTLKSELIWETIKGSLDGSEIPHKPRSWESVRYGTLSQTGIILAIKENFKAKRSASNNDARSIDFTPSILERLRKKYEVPTQIKVRVDGHVGHVGHASGDNNEAHNEVNDTHTDTENMSETSDMSDEQDRVSEALRKRKDVKN